ncbi:unnamed protein product [Closterium sp. NIES-65]|nr:unnamed protein product [Closterium sp. NIES-65]
MAHVQCLPVSVPPSRIPHSATCPPDMTFVSDLDSSELVPREFLCPLSGAIMRDPVIAPTGQSYDRASLDHFRTRGGRFCPKTGALLADCALIPNDALHQLIAAWCLSHATRVPSPPSPPPPLISASPLGPSPAVLPARSAPAAINGLASPPGCAPSSPLRAPLSPLQRRYSFQPSRSASACRGHGDEQPASDAASLAIPRHVMGAGSSGRSLCRTISPLSETASLDWAAASSAASSPSSPLRALRHRHNHQLAATSQDDANEVALSSYLSSNASFSRLQQSNPNSPRGSRRRSKDTPVREMRPFVDALQDADVAVRRVAAEAIHVAVKQAEENRTRVVQAGGVAPLLAAVQCEDEGTAQRACAALLYVSLAREGAREVVARGGIPVLVDVLRPAGEAGTQGEAAEATKANAAAALFTVSSTKEERKRLVCSAGAVPHLVHLVQTAHTPRALKDACLALYGLVGLRQAAEQAVALGVVALVVGLLERHGEGVEEKAASLLAVLARCEVGVAAIADDEDAVCALVDVMEGSSQHAADKAACTLLAMARHGGDAMARRIMFGTAGDPGAHVAARSCRLSSESLPSARSQVTPPAMPNTQYRLRHPTRYGKQPAVPAEFVCPLSLQLLTDPVITASGLTFERAVIQKWYRDGNRICPVTGSRLDHYRLFPNQAVRQLIAQWCDANAVPYAPGVLCVRVDPQGQQGTGSFRERSSQSRHGGPSSNLSQRPFTPPGTPPKSPRSAAPFSTLPGAFQRPRTPPSGADDRPFSPAGGESVPRNHPSASLSVSRSVSSGGSVQRIASGNGTQAVRGSPAGAMVPRTASGGGAVLRVVLGGGVPRVSSADSPRARISSAERIGSSPLSGDELGGAGARRPAGAPPNGAGPPQRRQAAGPRHRGSQSQVLRVLGQDGGGDSSSSGLARSHSLQPKADDIESLLNALEDDESDGYESGQSDALWRANEPLPVPRVASLGGRGAARGAGAGRGGTGAGRGGRGGRGAMADGVGRSDSLERGMMRAKQQGHAGAHADGSLRLLNGRNGIPSGKRPAQGGSGDGGNAESGLRRTSSLQSQGLLSASLGSLGLDTTRDSFRGAVEDLVPRRSAGAGARGEVAQSRFAGESGGESSSEREARRGAPGRPGGGIPPGARLLAAGRASQSFRDRASSDGSDSELKAALLGAIRSSSAGSPADAPMAGGGGVTGAGGGGAGEAVQGVRWRAGGRTRCATWARRACGRRRSAWGESSPSTLTASGSLRSPVGSSSMRVSRDGAMGARAAAIDAALRAAALPRSPAGRSSSSLPPIRDSSSSGAASGELGWGAPGVPRSPGRAAPAGAREAPIPRVGSREAAMHHSGPPLGDSPANGHTAPPSSARHPPPPLALRRDLSMDTWALASHLPASAPPTSAPPAVAPLSPIHSSGPLSPIHASGPPSPRLSSTPLSPRASTGPRSPVGAGARGLGGPGGPPRWRRDSSVESSGDAGSGSEGREQGAGMGGGGGGAGGRSPPMLQRSLGRRVAEEGALLRSGSIQSVQSVGHAGGGGHRHAQGQGQGQGHEGMGASDTDDPFLSALSSVRREQQLWGEGGMSGGEEGGAARGRGQQRGASSLAQSEGEGRGGSDWESDGSSMLHRRAAGAAAGGSRLGNREAGGGAGAGTSSGRNLGGAAQGRRQLQRGSSQTDNRGLGRAAHRALHTTALDPTGPPSGMNPPGGAQGLRRASSLAVVGGSGRQQGMEGMEGMDGSEGFHEVVREMKAEGGRVGGGVRRGEAAGAELSASHRRVASLAVQSRSSSSSSIALGGGGAMGSSGEGRAVSRRLSGGSGGGLSSRRSDYSLPPDASALLDELDGSDGSEGDVGDMGGMGGMGDRRVHGHGGYEAMQGNGGSGHMQPHQLQQHAQQQQQQQQQGHGHGHGHEEEAPQPRVGRVGGTFAWLREALRSPLKSPKPAAPAPTAPAPHSAQSIPLSPRSAQPPLPAWGAGVRPSTPPQGAAYGKSASAETSQKAYGKSATVPAPERRSLWGEARRAVGLGEGGGGDGGKAEEAFRRSSSEHGGQDAVAAMQWAQGERGEEAEGRGDGGRSGGGGRGGQGPQGRGMAVGGRELGEGRTGSQGSSGHEGMRDGGRGAGGRGLGGGAGRGGGRGGEGGAEGGGGGGRGQGWAKVRAVFPLHGEGVGRGAGGRGPGRGMGDGGRGGGGRGDGGRGTGGRGGAGAGPGVRHGGGGGPGGGREGGDSGRLSLERTSSLSSNHHAAAAADSHRDVDGSSAHPLSPLAAAAAASPPDMVTLVRAVAHGGETDRMEAVAAIRALVKGSRDNKSRLIAAGGVPALVRVLRHAHPAIKEHAVTAILNLSLVPGAPAIIASVGGIDAVAGVLQSGSQVARENAAAALFALSVDDGNQCLVRRAGAVLPLVDVLRSGSTRGRKDAALVLFNLSRDQRSRAEIVAAGAVPVLVGMLGSEEGGLEEKAMAVLANLCRMPEGCDDVLDLPGAIPTLVRVVAQGSQRAKEDAVMTLLMLANSEPASCHAMLAESMVPALQQVAQTGSQRSKGKARALLDLLRSQAQRGRGGADR